MSYLNTFLSEVKKKNPHELEFLQAVEEFAHSIDRALLDWRVPAVHS